MTKNIDLFLVLKWEDDSNAFEMATAGIIVSWIFAFNFLICEFGQWVNSRYEAYSSELTECDWYALPMEMQRMYMIFLVNAQQPMHIESYAGIECTRDTLKKVDSDGQGHSL